MLEAIKSLFLGTGTASSILFVCLTAFTGILLGKVSIKNIKLGVAGTLFTGIVVSHFGATLEPEVLHFIREFGLILFVYAIGIDIGPRFLNSLRNEGLKLNMLASMVVVIGFITALVIYYVSGVSPAVITGIMSGAVTNTPGLGAAQQALKEFGGNMDGEKIGMAYAVAYPLGVIGIILTLILIKRIFKVNIDNEVKDYQEQFFGAKKKLETVEIHITNQNLFGKEMSYIKHFVDNELVISRIFRDGEYFIPQEKDTLQEEDVVVGVAEISRLDDLRVKLGKVEMSDKREVSGDLAMFHVLVTNRKYAGKTIEQIGIYRRYEANITRIFRSGIEMLPTRQSNIELGDTVRIVGKRDLLEEVRNELGNSMKELSHPNTIPIFFGIFLGVILGSIPFFIPGMPAPAKLGLAGGPLVMAIILGHKGRIGKYDFYMTPGANMMIKELGIILFLSCVGLSSGATFVNTIANGGYVWVGYGAIITILPILIVGVVARMMKLNYLKICGIISGSMTDPPALEFSNTLAPIQAQSTAYSTVYPLTMFLRILLAQTLILITLQG